MLAWLADLGLTSSAFGSQTYILYACACAIAVLMISSIVSVIFGVVLGIFHR